MKPTGTGFEIALGMKHLRFIFVLFLSIQLTLSPVHAASDGASDVHLSMGTNSDGKSPLVTVDVEVSQLDATVENANSISNLAFQKSNLPRSTVVLSSDNELLTQTADNENQTAKNHIAVVPVNPEVLNDSVVPKKSQVSPFYQAVKNFTVTKLDAIKSDKIGLMVVTYTTASETLVWIHSTQLSQFEKTGNIIYTVMLATIFGLNKDAWSITTRPIQKFFRKFLKPEDESRTNVKQLTSQFLGNLTLAGLVTSVRIPLMSMDQIIQQGLQLHFFTMPLLLTLVSTTAIFTWSEHISMINEKTHMLTKFVFRRANELRSVVLGTVATTAALLNPGQHGLTPWVTMAAVGAAGATIYLNGEAITSWLETHPKLQPLRKYLIKLQCQGLF